MVGCGETGPPQAVVTGTVSLDGEPLETGEILFIDHDGTQAPDATSIENGKYELPVEFRSEPN